MTDSASIERQFYITGGTLPPNTPSYIRRQADDELYRRVLAGEFCYVLTPRQMGKSSLMARTAKRLQTGSEQIHSVIIDLTKIGAEKERSSGDQWYYGIAHAIARGLSLQLDQPLASWWAEQTLLPPLQRLSEFFDLILANTTGRIVIFIDEIDTTIALPFSDDFFAAIRSCYNQRATNASYERLTFVLLGVATPSDLMKDNARTPFNIGSRINLTDFSPHEATPLAQGLDHDSTIADQLLARVLYWTNGHPYLTQKLCDLLSTVSDRTSIDDVVDRLVEKHFLAPEANRAEYNLAFVRDRLMGADRRREILQLYRNIVTGKKIADDPLSPLHTTLKLSGLVVPDATGTLHIRNRIYQAVFTADWAKVALPRDTNRYVAIASLLLFIMGVGTWYTQFLPRAYVDALQAASEDYPERAYEALKGIPGYSGKADALLADYWNRRSIQFQATGDRDEALWTEMKSLTVVDTDRQRREINLLVDKDYGGLLSTHRHGDIVTAIAFSPDGTLVLTGSGDHTARLWRTDTGALVAEVKHQERVMAVAFSPDGKLAMTGSDDRTARLWRTDTGAPVSAPLKHEAAVTVVAFSPNGTLALTGSEDGTARLWRTDTGAPVSAPLKHEAAAKVLAFSPDGTLVLTNSKDGTARLWRTDTGAPVGVPLKHAFVSGGVFSPNGKLALTGSLDGTVRLWRPDTGAPVGVPLKPGSLLTAVAFSPDGTLVLTGSGNGTARLWRSDTGAPVGVPLKHERVVTSVAFSPDGTLALTGSVDGTARLWQSDTGAPVGTPLRHVNSVRSVAFSPDGTLVLTGSGDHTARLWRTDTDSPVSAPLKHEAAITAVAFSPDGKLAVTGSLDHTAQLWHTDTDAPVHAPLKHESSITVTVFSPDGTLALTGSEDRTARLWRTDTGTPVGAPLQHANAVRAVAFSPDGKLALTGSSDGTARLWRTDSGAPVGMPLNQNYRTGSLGSDIPATIIHVGVRVVLGVTAVSFSPDGKLALICSGNTARFWRTDTGAPVGTPLKHERTIQAVAFSPDGARVIVATNGWLHSSTIMGESLKYSTSRLLRGSWAGGLHFLDRQASRIMVGITPIADAALIQTVRLDEPDASPIEGDSDTLLDEWQKKLALTFKNGKIAPLYQTPERLQDYIVFPVPENTT